MMPWVKLDEKFARNPKVVEAGPLGIAMQVAGLCYCNDNLTDGRIPRAIAAILLDFTGLGMRMWSGELAGGGEDAGWELVVEDLIASGLWHEPGHNCEECAPITAGYVIHDYFDYQPSKLEVVAQREQKAAAGRKGGKASAQARAKASVQAPASPPAQAERQAESNPVPVPVTDIEPLTTFEVAPLKELKAVLVEIFGEPPEKRWSLYNRVATWIRDRGGTPDDVRFRASRIVEEWGAKALTITSLESHWTRYDAEVGNLTPEAVKHHQNEMRRLRRRQQLTGET